MTGAASRKLTVKRMIQAFALGALAVSSVARADVLEIGPSGPAWVAGGPVYSTAYSTATSAPADTSPSTDYPALTQAGATAGPARWRAHVAQLAARYDLSPALLEALVWQESRWNTQAISPVGARGLAQLMPGTARALGVDPNDPEANLEGGARYLRQQLDTFDGNLEKALAAYNAGPGRVMRAGGVPRIAETQAYVAAIMARLANPVRR